MIIIENFSFSRCKVGHVLNIHKSQNCLKYLPIRCYISNWVSLYHSSTYVSFQSMALELTIIPHENIDNWYSLPNFLAPSSLLEGKDQGDGASCYRTSCPHFCIVPIPSSLHEENVGKIEKRPSYGSESAIAAYVLEQNVHQVHPPHLGVCASQTPPYARSRGFEGSRYSFC